MTDSKHTPRLLMAEATADSPSVTELLAARNELRAQNAALLAALRIVAGCVADDRGGTTLGSWEMEKVRAALAAAEGE